VEWLVTAVPSRQKVSQAQMGAAKPVRCNRKDEMPANVNRKLRFPLTVNR